ncbi:RnfH family protein [Comamonas aquatilis]|uniref:RnfH family protein n=1 Tax=Comamonas aquatilis TaxID=1778406 RepID=UPI0039EEDAD7
MTALHITLSYSAAAGQVHEQEMELAPGATVADALQTAGGLSALGFTDEKGLPPFIGIWGKLTKPEHFLKDGDRVELYRPLTVDPKIARRERFARQGARGAGLFKRQRPGAKAGY